MEGDKEVHRNDSEAEHAHANFEHWLESQIGSDVEASRLWLSLREVIQAQSSDKEIRPASLYQIVLTALSTLNSEHSQIRQEASKIPKDKKKIKDAHEIDPSDLTHSMKDRSVQLSATSIVRIAAAARVCQYTITKVPASVIWATLSQFSSIVLSLLRGSFPHNVCTPLLNSIPIAISSIPPAIAHTNPGTQSMFSTCLHLCVAGKPKVRRRAVRSVQVILEHFRKNGSTTTCYEHLCKIETDFIEEGFNKISSKTSNNFSVQLYLLELVKHTLASVPASAQVSWCTSTLGLTSLCSPLVTQCVFLTFDHFFNTAHKRMTETDQPNNGDNENHHANNQTESSMDISIQKKKLEKSQQKLIIKIVNSMFESQPSSLDKAPLEAFANCIASAFKLFVFTSDPHALISKYLPKVFASLMNVLKQPNGGQESFPATCESLKTILIQGIPESFIDLELSPLESPPFDYSKSSNLIINSICNHIANSLQVAYHETWHQSLQVASALFQRLANSTLTNNYIVDLDQCTNRWNSIFHITEQLLERIHNLRNDDSIHKKVDPVLKYVLQAIGIENFFKIFPVSFPDTAAGNIEGQNLWALAFLRENLSHSSLLYFNDHFIPEAMKLAEQSQDNATKGRHMAAKHLMTIHNQVWSVFPRFCLHPRDIRDSFSLIAENIGNAINDLPSVRHDIANGLTNLITRVKGSQETVKEKETVLSNLLSEDLKAIAVYSENYIPILFNIFLGKLNPDERSAIISCVEAFLSISPHELINQFYSEVIKNLLSTTTVTKEADSEEMDSQESKNETIQHLTSLSVAFVPYLNNANLSVLFKTVLPNLTLSSRHHHIDSPVQKKSWKVLRAISEQKKEFVLANLPQIQSILAKAELVGAHKIMVIKAVSELMNAEQLVQWLQGQDKSFQKFIGDKSKSVVVSPLPSVVLGYRESAAKTRQASQITLESIASIIGADKLAGILVVGLTAPEAHFKAATISCFTAILQRFGTELATLNRGQQLFSILKTAVLLLDWQGSEVRTATLALIKAALKPTPSSMMSPLLPSIVKTLVDWPDNVKTKYMKEMRMLLEKFISKFGYDTVAAAMPKVHLKFLQNIHQRSQHAKKASKKGTTDSKYSKPSKSESEKSSGSDNDTDSDDDELDDSNDSHRGSHKKGMDIDSSEPKGSKKKNGSSTSFDPTWLVERSGDMPIDFTDPTSNRNILSSDPSKSKRTKTTNPFKSDEEGKLIIEDLDSKLKPRSKNSSMIVTDDMADKVEERIVNRKRKRYETTEVESGDEADYKATSSSSNGVDVEKRVWYDSTARSFNAKTKRPKLDPGAVAAQQVSSYKSSKAHGDSSKAGRPDPHAYVKPNPAFLNKRHRAQSAKQYEALIGKKSKR